MGEIWTPKAETRHRRAHEIATVLMIAEVDLVWRKKVGSAFKECTQSFPWRFDQHDETSRLDVIPIAESRKCHPFSHMS